MQGALTWSLHRSREQGGMPVEMALELGAEPLASHKDLPFLAPPSACLVPRGLPWGLLMALVSLGLIKVSVLRAGAGVLGYVYPLRAYQVPDA